MSDVIAERRLKQFQQKFGEAMVKFATHAALPVVLNSELVHLLRLNFFYSDNSISYLTEAEFLLSSFCREIGEDLYEIEPAMRTVLLQKLYQQHPERIKEIAAFLWQYTKRYTPWRTREGLQNAQLLTALNFLDAQKANEWFEEVETSEKAYSPEDREWFVAMKEQIENESTQINPYTKILKLSGNLTEFLETSVRELEKLAHTDYNQLFLIIYPPEDSRQLIAVADIIPSHKQRYRIAAFSGLIGISYSSGKTINAKNVGEMPKYINAVPETKSELVIPIKKDNIVLGVLNSESEELNHYDNKIFQNVEQLALAMGKLLPLFGWADNITLYDAPWIQMSPELERPRKDRERLAVMKSQASVDTSIQTPQPVASRIKIVMGDITEQNVDAIVNTTNTSFTGGYVANAISHKAGKEIEQAFLNDGGCKRGEAKITDGYNLPVRFVIHTIGPNWRKNKSDEEILAQCYRSCLELAVQYSVKTIAFPSISTGGRGFPIEKASKIAVREVVNFLMKNASIEKVIFVLFKKDAYDYYHAELESLLQQKSEKRKPFNIQYYQPYVTGAGLFNDRTFVGRSDLLAWLANLWQQPDGKSAVVLIGQRRIGITSLLNKIKRDGLKITNLIPVYIDTQEIGDKGEHSFLTTVSEKMAQVVGMEAPVLNAAPYLDFQHFLTKTKAILDNRRFLLMIDGSEPIFQNKFGSELPPFLRNLMQHADYPTRLLFCGTYFLKQVVWDSSSVLFNTAQFKSVSYLSATESAELLQKPSRDILEFDEYALEQAYLLTHGQPLLLQCLGAYFIEEFNATVRAGKGRNNYIDFKDLENAALVLVQQQDNMVFIDHWKGSDTATHQVLSALAWATDETNHPQLDIDGIQAALTENRLDLPKKQIFDIIRRLVDEEILERAGETYRFAVPLYRRWIAWRWEPMTVREEGI